MNNVFEGERIMSRSECSFAAPSQPVVRSEYVANIQGFSACASKGRAAKVSKGGLNVFKLAGFAAGVMLACMVVF